MVIEAMTSKMPLSRKHGTIKSELASSSPEKTRDMMDFNAVVQNSESRNSLIASSNPHSGSCCGFTAHRVVRLAIAADFTAKDSELRILIRESADIQFPYSEPDFTMEQNVIRNF
jgi:hypothetical protein